MCVFVVYLCVVWTTFVRLLGRGHSWLLPSETLCELVCVCVCVWRVCVCVRPYVDACQKKSMGVCVHWLCLCVLWGPHFCVCYGGA